MLLNADISSMFKAGSNLLDDGTEAASIRPVYSRVLIRDVHDDEKRGSLYLPQGDYGKDLKRQGIVVAVGRGDKYSARLIRDGNGTVRTQRLADCETCSGTGEVEGNVCQRCRGDRVKRYDMEVKVGDRVLYDRRREAEFIIRGVRYSLVDEYQSIFGILED